MPQSQPSTEPWGAALRINAAGCAETRKSPEAIHTFLNTVVSVIGMVPYGPAQILRFGPGDLIGVTGLQWITTSHLLVHALDSPFDPKTRTGAEIFVRLESCAPFDPATVLRIFEARFKPREGYAEMQEITTDRRTIAEIYPMALVLAL